MLKKIAVIGGIVAVAGLGVGGAAWAGANESAPQATVASSATAAPAVATLTTSAPASGTSSSGKGKGAKVKAAKVKGAQAKGAKAKHPDLARRLEKVSHAQWVSKDGKTGTFVTHDAARGTVSAVGAGSITIKAADGTSETFTINTVTKVHVKGNAKGTTGTISQVKVGDAAGVLGTGAGSMTATHVIDRGVPKAPKTAVTTAPTTS